VPLFLTLLLFKWCLILDTSRRWIGFRVSGFQGFRVSGFQHVQYCRMYYSPKTNLPTLCPPPSRPSAINTGRQSSTTSTASSLPHALRLGKWRESACPESVVHSSIARLDSLAHYFLFCQRLYPHTKAASQEPPTILSQMDKRPRRITPPSKKRLECLVPLKVLGRTRDSKQQQKSRVSGVYAEMKSNWPQSQINNRHSHALMHALD
jgi:hypothetical protein